MQMIGSNGRNQFRQMLEIIMGFVVLGIVNQIAIQNGNDNVVAARAKGNANRNNGNQIRCYNYRGVGHYAINYTIKPKKRDAIFFQTQLLIAQKEEEWIQLQAEEFDLMAFAGDIKEIEEVNANYILMANLRQTSTSGTQTGKARIYDYDGSAEVVQICLWIYFNEGLGYNLFLVGQFCDLDLEDAFRGNTCFIRNLEGVDLLVYNRRTRKITETMNVTFDELSAMAFEQREMTFFLSLQVNQSPRGIYINQSNYVLEILKKYGMETYDPIGTPMEIKDKLDLDKNGTLVDAMKYRSMIGALMYLTSSRLDIDSGFEITGFLDADYEGCRDFFKNASGGTQFLGEKLVGWSSKKQDYTALSIAKAEYVSVSACYAQVIWMRIQLTIYGFHFNKIPIYCDSKTDYQLADLFTKALIVDMFNYLARRLGMCSLSPQELGRLAKSQ
nr:hypothetical protein [Tanacetum cinerariifolium]